MQCFLAFNKSIQLELADRLPRQCSATTFHSLGNTAIRNSGRRPKLNGDKSKWLVKPLLKGKESSVYWTPACKLISYAKNAGIGPLVPDTVDAWLGLIETFSLEFSGDDRRLVEISRAAYLLGNNSDSIDFDDMLYWPLLHDMPFDKTSTVFVDEAQDTNIVQRALLRKMLFPNGRVIAVGDPSQAIYGFRGASADALTRLKEDFSMTVLPLSVSYRCSQAVVKEAQKFDKGTI
jgi:superfamily I DNA/RNA helicase